MKAVLLTDYGGVDKLVVTELPEPDLGPHDVKVRVRGASINPVDWKLRRGDLRALVPLELPAILGRDVAGDVIAVGDEVTTLRVGEPVLGLVQHGYAEVVVAPADSFAKIPDELESYEAAALPLVGLTGAQLVEEVVAPKPGDSVLVTGAVGSVGRVAVFAARKLGARVIAGVRASQRELAESLDVDAVVALDEPGELERLPLVDAVADTVNGDVMESLLVRIRPGGVLGTVLSEPKGARDRLLTVRTMLAHPDSTRLSDLASALARGELALPIDGTYPLAEVRTAHQLAEQHGVAKVVLVT
ncbi:MAG TPA: NADP-dependent oxidoreductase [Polyangiaceae bacterium]